MHKSAKKIIDITFHLNCGHVHVTPWDVLHRHNEVELTFFLVKRPVLYLIGGQMLRIHPEDTLLFWGALPHQLISIEKENLQYWLTIPPENFIQWDIPKEMINRILEGEILVETDPTLRRIDLLQFDFWEKDVKANTPDSLTTFALSLQARLRRFGTSVHSPYSDRVYAKPRIVPPQKETFLRLHSYILNHFSEPLRLSRIAAYAGIHGNYAATLFKQKFGVTIVDFITMLRVFEAQRQILTTNKKIIDIAMEVGFRSMSHFYKCFHKFCKRNPKDYRKELWKSTVL